MSHETDMEPDEFFRILASCYRDKPDDFVISLGDVRRPHPNLPIGIANLPEVMAVMSITLGQVRKWGSACKPSL